MNRQEANDEIARIMGLKSPMVLETNVWQGENPEKGIVLICARTTEKQLTKIKKLLSQYWGQ